MPPKLIAYIQFTTKKEILMRTFLILLGVLNSLSIFGQVTVTKQDAEKIISEVKWKELGTRLKVSLSEAEAECMTLTNYDDKVDFDCIVSNGSEEADISKADLQRIIRTADSGLSTVADRVNMTCNKGGKCLLSNRLSKEEQYHRYCYMTSHTSYGGKLIEESVFNGKIVVDSISCKTTPSFNSLGESRTIIEAELIVKENFGTTLEVDTFHYWNSVSGTVSSYEACDSINRTFKDEEVTAKVERELVKTEWTSIRNSDKSLYEKVGLTFANGIFFNGGETKQVSQGKFCSQF